jgi:hypothetical protein
VEADTVIEEDREEQLRPDAPVFDVTSVRRSRGIPRWVLAAAFVGVVAFVGGLAVATPAASPVRRSIPSATADPAPSSVALVAAEATPSTTTATPGPDQGAVEGRPVPTAAPGSSAFVEGFVPGDLVRELPGGERCATGDPLDNDVPRTRRDGPRLTFQRSWLVYCRIPETARRTFLVDLFQSIADVTPADTYGYRSTRAGEGNALYPYAEPPMAGTVSVHADAAGKGLALVIVIQEWRSD